MPVDDDDMIVSTTDYLLSENVLNPEATAAEIEAFVALHKATSIVTLTTNQGGIRRIVLTEKTKATDGEANLLRKAMGMDYEEETDEPDADETD